MALAIVLLAALAVRLYGIDWDDGHDLHPDELFITKFVLNDRIHLDWPIDGPQLLDPAQSGLNPRSADPVTGEFREFAYGALPLWVTDAVAWVISRLTGIDWNATDREYLVGRALSAVLSAATVIPIAVLGVSIGGRSVGLSAALFAALAPMSVQLAHFFTTDSWLTFFVACCVLAGVSAATSGTLGMFALSGALFGLAMATKGSVFALAVPILAAIVVDALRRWHGDPPNAMHAAVARSAAAAMSALLAFFAFEPYALLRPDVYLHSLRVQADIASGAFDVPFTRVYAGTTPLLYQIEQFVRWGYGPAAGLLALAGIGLLVKMAIRQRAPSAVILCAWLAAYSVIIALSDVKFLRYLEPLAPVFAVGAALAVAKLTGIVRMYRPSLPRLMVPMFALTLVVAWAGAFLTVYAHEHPRLAASRWIYGSIPPGSVLTAEYWDDALPRGLSYVYSPALFGLGGITMDLYRDRPPTEARDAIFADLSRADYVIQSSERVEAAVRAAPWRYPVQGRYYAQLARGALGFVPVATFERRPAIGRFAIDDGSADESFVNYDHPRVSIYERDAVLSRAEYGAAMSWSLRRPWFPLRAPPEPSLLLDTPVGQNPAVNDARWSAEVTSAPAAALAVWLLLMIALFAVGWPMARLLMPMFPDAGSGIARVLALVVAAYIVWLGASLDLFRFRAVWVICALLATGGVAWFLASRAGELPLIGRADPRWRFLVHAEASFWCVFLLFLAFRLANPDGWHPLWGGEKPMEFAQINAISRSAYFPPYDPWYADGYVNYYYYGFYLMAFLFKATGIPAEIGFNLALPAVMGMIASGGFSVAAALGRGVTRSRPLGIVAGWLGVIFVCLMGNLTAVRGLVEGIPAGGDPFFFWAWSGSRAIDFAITEFPYFSGLYADLHAHVIALPLTIATIALCYAIASTSWHDRSPATRQNADRWDRPTMARLAMLALLLGSLGVTNAWDVPVYAALSMAAIFMGTATVRTWRRRTILTAGLSVATLVAAWLLFLPFHRHFVVLFSQIAFVRDPTDLRQFLTHLGGLITICALGVVALLLARGQQRISRVAVAVRPVPSWKLWLSWAARIAVSVVVVLAVWQGRAVFGLALALGCVASAGWVVLRRSADRFVCLLFAAAAFIAAGAELVVVADDLIDSPWYRMNTVFKFYNQVWVLLALAGAAFAALMIRDSRRRIAAATSARFPGGRGTWSRFGVAIASLVFLASLAYPLLATGPRLDLRFTPGTQPGTLNALGWMDTGTVPIVGHPEFAEIAFAGDASAIDWLLANVTGSPVIAEASIGPYRCNGSRISAATGLPTIIGWERHQQQQRFPETLPQRVADVRTLYVTRDPAEKTAILRRYNVEYVIVGELERRYPIANNECTPTGSAAGIATFEDLVGTTLEVAHSAAGTTIYRVLPMGGV